MTENEMIGTTITMKGLMDCIEIEVEKTLLRGRRMLKVLRIDGVLEYSKLPAKYTEGEEPYCYLNQSTQKYIDFRNGCDVHDLYVGEQYTPEQMEEIINAIKKCGGRLHRINDEIREDNKDWTGHTTYQI